MASPMDIPTGKLNKTSGLENNSSKITIVFSFMSKYYLKHTIELKEIWGRGLKLRIGFARHILIKFETSGIRYDIQ